ncbi:MAG: glycosyltransferase family 2 protein [Deltaproteobacteria bacterium]|nr:glycosyltransferase family 2 protein [Deltaproteobacteria bacterium]
MMPDVSVVIVADYAAGEAATYNSLRPVLQRLAEQTFTGEAEFIVVESERFRHRLPGDLTTILPTLRIVLAEGQDSFALRNVGTQHAAAAIVAFLDADCVPERDWLHWLVAALAQHQEVAVVSGRTTYGGNGLLTRTLSLLSRAYVDRGGPGEVRHLSYNNAAFHTNVLLSHPFPTSTNPFVSALHAGAILQDGGHLWFEPKAQVTHAFGGWTVECDVSRNAGWATVAIRQMDSQARLARLVSLGHGAIPVFVLISLLRSWGRVLRLWHHYGLAWYEVPIALGVAAATSVMQIPGMRAALRGRTIADTPYR